MKRYVVIFSLFFCAALNGAGINCNAGISTIPLVDLEGYENASPEERAALVHKFGHSLRFTGFVAIKAEKLTPLLNKVYREMEGYFHRPVEQKMQDWHNNSGQSGFSPKGNERAAGAKKADIKETFFIPPHLKKWPKQSPAFEATMKEYHKEMTRYAVLAMKALHEYLGEATADVEKQVASGQNLLRLAYYPAPSEKDEPEAVWAAAHEDLNALTLLPPATESGLELQTKDGEWMPVIVPEGYLIVNTGEQVQHKTAGMIRATRHQVVNRSQENKERFSSIFFASWAPDSSLKPFASCVKKICTGFTDEEKKTYLSYFPDVTVSEGLTSRLIEMRSIVAPDRETVARLKTKGLLRQAPKELVAQYPDLF